MKLPAALVRHSPSRLGEASGGAWVGDGGSHGALWRRRVEILKVKI